MHIWGDEWFEKFGDDLYAAQSYIYKFVRTWSLCTLISKEKYGSIRYEFMFPPGGAVSLRRFDFILIKLFGTKQVNWSDGKESYSYTTPKVTWQNSYLYNKWVNLGKIVLRLAIKKAIKKWPHIKRELVADFNEGEFLNS